MIESLNTIDALADQITALLDLMQACEKCLTMMDELMREVEKIQDEVCIIND